MRTAVGVIFFECKDEVERLIESVYKEVDYVFLVDGRLKHFEDDHDLSQDGSRDLVFQYPNIKMIDAPNLLEHEKRMEYLKLCEQFKIDVLLIIDSDEYIHPDSDWKRFKVELIQNKRDYIYKIKNYTYSPVTQSVIPVDAPRVWRSPSLLEYKYDRHYQFGLIGREGVLTAKKTLYGIKLIHDPHLRTFEYREKYERFCEWRIEYEKYKQLVETNKEKAYRQECVWAGN